MSNYTTAIFVGEMTLKVLASPGTFPFPVRGPRPSGSSLRPAGHPLPLSSIPQGALRPIPTWCQPLGWAPGAEEGGGRPGQLYVCRWALTTHFQCHEGTCWRRGAQERAWSRMLPGVLGFQWGLAGYAGRREPGSRVGLCFQGAVWVRGTTYSLVFRGVAVDSSTPARLRSPDVYLTPPHRPAPQVVSLGLYSGNRRTCAAAGMYWTASSRVNH